MKNDCTIILVTHHMSEAENVSDKIIIIKEGKIFKDEKLENLK